MKRVVAAALILSSLVALAGCNVDRSGPPPLSNDERYRLCIEAGGSYEYNGSLPYFQCTMPKAEESK